MQLNNGELQMIKRILMILSFLFLLPLACFGNGTYSPGTVQITPMFDGGQSLSAAYNVRYNPAATSNEYISLQYTTGINPVVAISAVDTNGTIFLCYVNPSDQAWPSAQYAVSAAGNGAEITATHAVNKTHCDSLTVYVSSPSLD